MVYKIITGTTRNAKLAYRHTFHNKLHALKKAKELRKRYDLRFRVVKD